MLIFVDEKDLRDHLCLCHIEILTIPQTFWVLYMLFFCLKHLTPLTSCSIQTSFPLVFLKPSSCFQIKGAFPDLEVELILCHLDSHDTLFLIL